MDSNQDFASHIPHFYALASKLEAEGQYNNAKLVRAAADAIARQLAYPIQMPTSKAELAAELHQAAAVVAQAGVDKALTQAMNRGAEMMAEGKLPLLVDAPHPYVCRICGYLAMEAPGKNCPVCQARPRTFRRFMPIYWLDNFDPFEVLHWLRQTPGDVGALLKGLSEEQMNANPAAGGWNIRNAVAHLRDAQGLFEYRINLMIEQDHPKLEAKAVFDWATEEKGRPATTMEIYDMYLQSRQRVVNLLEALPLKDWWRTGKHQEFGVVTIKQQASYFASHELTHLSQIQLLIE